FVGVEGDDDVRDRLRLPDGGGDDGHRPRTQLPAGEAPDDVPRLGELPIGEVRIDVVDDDRSRAREGGEQQVGDELFEVVQRVQRRLPGEGQVEVRAPQRHV